MKTSTSVLLGLASLSALYLATRASKGAERGTEPLVRRTPYGQAWTDADAPEEISALPEPDRTVAGNAFYGQDARVMREVAASLRARGYDDAAHRLDLRAMVVEASR